MTGDRGASRDGEGGAGSAPACKLLAVGLLLGFLFAPGARAADISIDLIGTLSGAAAARAADQMAGFQLGSKDIGGRLGGIDFAFNAFDDHGSADEATRLFDSLPHTARLRVLLLSSAAARAAEFLAPLAAANGTIIINLGDVESEQAGRGCNANFFSLVDTPETRSAIDGQYLQTLGLHLLAVVGPDTLSTQDAIARLQRTYRGRVAVTLTRPGRMSFSGALATIVESHPDAVYLLHTGGMAVEFLTQFAAAGLKAQTLLMAPYTTLDQTTLAASAPAALEAISVGPWVDDLENPSNHRLSSEFEIEYGRPPSVQAALGYDAALLLDAAVRAMDKKTIDVDYFRIALRRAEFASTRGTVKFDTNQFPIQTYFVRQVVADSRGRMVNGQKAPFARDVRDGRSAECPLRWVAEASAPSKKK